MLLKDAKPNIKINLIYDSIYIFLILKVLKYVYVGCDIIKTITLYLIKIYYINEYYFIYSYWNPDMQIIVYMHEKNVTRNTW